jgi:transcriptional regulator with XRE-family HTH domain
MTQRDLAELVGVKASHIAYIEGEQRNPSLTLLRRLADTLGLNRRELLFLIHPDAKELTDEQPRQSGNGKPDGWRQFSTNLALLRRYNVSPDELKVLKQVDSLGPVSNPRNFLFVLNSIRMAAGDAV